MSVSRSMPAFVVAVLLSTVAAAENWPQWRGPGGQGISSEPGIPTEWQPDRNVRWKVAGGARAFLAGGVGRSPVRDRGHRRRRAAGQEGRRAHDGREALGASRQRGGRPETHVQGAGDRGEGRQDGLGADRVRGAGLRRAPPRQQLCRTDAGHRREDGVRLLRSRGSLRLRRGRQARVEGRGALSDAWHGYGHLAGSVREPRDHSARRGQRRAFGDRRLRQAHRQGSLAGEAQRADLLGDAGPRRYRAARRAGDERDGVRHRLRPGQRQGAVALARRREQCHSHAARRGTAW